MQSNGLLRSKGKSRKEKRIGEERKYINEMDKNISQETDLLQTWKFNKIINLCTSDLK